MARRSIEGTRAIVTGASSGIGRALAIELARQGARLVIVARREEKLREVAAEIAKVGAAAEIVVGDVTKPETRAAMIAAAKEHLGGLDLLINNAGVGALGHFSHADAERLRQIMEVNFFAVAETIREALPALRRGNRPMIVNISSVLGHRSVPRMSEYCASKFALQGLSESLRAELRGRGIDLLVVSPGTTQSEFFDNLIETRTPSLFPNRPRATAESVARQIVRAIRRGRREIVPSASGKLLIWANRACPWLVDLVLERTA